MNKEEITLPSDHLKRPDLKLLKECKKKKKKKHKKKKKKYFFY